MEDQGFTLKKRKGEVVLSTNKAVTDIAMTPDQAVAIAAALVKLAQEIINENQSN